jgi:hypothetical protein
VLYAEVAGHGTFALTLSSGVCLYSSAAYRDSIPNLKVQLVVDNVFDKQAPYPLRLFSRVQTMSASRAHRRISAAFWADTSFCPSLG